MAAIINYLARPSHDLPEHMDRHNELAGWDRDEAREAAALEGI
jgi:hypothetical protein